MATFNFVRKSFYRDSVTLMRLSRDLEQMAGVTSAAAMMATPTNRALLAQAGLLSSEGAAAGAADLIVAVVADCVEAADAAQEAVARSLLTRPSSARGAVGAAPRTLEA